MLAEEINQVGEGLMKSKVPLEVKNALRSKVLEVLDRYKNGKDVFLVLLGRLYRKRDASGHGPHRN